MDKQSRTRNDTKKSDNDMSSHTMTNRCVWARGDLMTAYHDTEWGRPEHNDTKLFEFLVLEGAQAGLSWATILKRRDGYRRAFSNFDPLKVSKYTLYDIERLLQDNSIIRNKLKINSAINNAQKFLKVKSEFGSFNAYLWDFVGDKPILNCFETHSELPAYTGISKKLAFDLKRYGFTFVGPTICYAFMQAVGMVNDHTIDCFLGNQLL